MCCHLSDINLNNEQEPVRKVLRWKHICGPFPQGLLEFPGLLISSSIGNEIMNMRVHFKQDAEMLIVSDLFI